MHALHRSGQRQRVAAAEADAAAARLHALRELDRRRAAYRMLQCQYPVIVRVLQACLDVRFAGVVAGHDVEEIAFGLPSRIEFEPELTRLLVTGLPFVDDAYARRRGGIGMHR